MTERMIHSITLSFACYENVVLLQKNSGPHHNLVIFYTISTKLTPIDSGQKKISEIFYFRPSVAF